MKAELKTYRTNAILFADGNTCTIEWDGMEFDTAEEYGEWIAEQLTPAAGAQNYDEIKMSLEIATDYLRP